MFIMYTVCHSASVPRVIRRKQSHLDRCHGSTRCSSDSAAECP